jgi:hypothetical protein
VEGLGSRVSPPGKLKALMKTAKLVLVLGLSSGCNQILGLDEATEIQPNAYQVFCPCTPTGIASPINVTTAVCLPDALNPNKSQVNHQLTQQDLEDDVANRVLPNIQGFVDFCVSHVLQCTCIPSVVDLVFAADECDAPCVGEDLQSNCGNWNNLSNPPHKTATNLPGQPPVCTVATSDPPTPVPDPLAASIFGTASSCDVTGTVTISRGGDSQTQSVSGAVRISGNPCPGGSCSVGMSYRLDKIANFKFDGFGGFDAAEFMNLLASGASIPAGATLDASGNGTFAAGSTRSFGQGKRSDQACVPKVGCVEVGSSSAGFTGANGQPIGMGVDWHGHSCELSGALFGQLEDADTSATANLTGTIVNEPPTASAGPLQNVECTSAAGAGITLDSSASTDPDGNIVLRVWRQGTRAGPEIGHDPTIHVDQALGGSQAYFLRVVDAFGQSSESSTEVTVADTTPPTIRGLAVTPSTLWPPDGKVVPVSVSVSPSDACDPNPSCALTQITSNEPLTPDDARITGPLTAQLAARRLGTGSGRSYTLTVRCTDASGNGATAAATVSVTHDQG